LDVFSYLRLAKSRAPIASCDGYAAPAAHRIAPSFALFFTEYAALARCRESTISHLHCARPSFAAAKRWFAGNKRWFGESKRWFAAGKRKSSRMPFVAQSSRGSRR